MVWVMWLGMMVAVPVAAGVQIWFQLRNAAKADQMVQQEELS